MNKQVSTLVLQKLRHYLLLYTKHFINVDIYARIHTRTLKTFYFIEGKLIRIPDEKLGFVMLDDYKMRKVPENETAK